MSKTSLRVMVMETATRCADLLRSEGHEVELVSQFDAGLPRLSEHRFDLAVLDLALPGAAGLDHFVKAHDSAPHLPLVVLTDRAREKLGRDALKLGAQDYLVREEMTGAAVTLALRKAVLRHHSQAASRRDRHLLEILMEKIPDAIYFKDTESRFLRISRAHARKFNLANTAQAIGLSDADFFSEAHARQALADEQQTMKTGQPLVGFEEMETWPDGSVTWVSTTKMPMRDPSGRIIGTFGISRDITERKRAQLALAERTLELQRKNQQIEDELKMARELQLAMLPQTFPCVQPAGPDRRSALEFFSFFIPSGAVSGDFFDVVELSPTSVGLFICDVMGHDVRAALVTAMMRSLVQDLSHAEADPGQLLAQINRALAGVFQQTGTTMFATAFYMVADIATGELRYASAAHPDALHLRRAQGRVEELIAGAGRKGPAIGLFGESEFPTCRRQLEVGDLILLFTDGLIEASGPSQECYSQERLVEAVQRHSGLESRAMVDAVVTGIKSFCAPGEFSDDVCIVGVEVRRLGQE